MARRTPLQGSGLPESWPRRPRGPTPAGPRRLADAARGVSCLSGLLRLASPRGRPGVLSAAPQGGWGLSCLRGALGSGRWSRPAPRAPRPHLQAAPRAASPGTESAFPPLRSGCFRPPGRARTLAAQSQQPKSLFTPSRCGVCKFSTGAAGRLSSPRKRATRDTPGPKVSLAVTLERFQGCDSERVCLSRVFLTLLWLSVTSANNS